MRKVVLVLGMILFCLPALGQAQVSPVGSPGLLPLQLGQPLGTSIFPSAMIPGVGTLDLGSVRLRPSAAAFYSRIGMNVNVPSPVNDSTIRESNADVRLKDDYWAGYAWLTGDFGRDVSFFLGVGANIPKKVTLFTDEEPYDGHLRNRPYAWKGSNLQWWTASGGIEYNVRPGCRILAGLAYDQFSVGLQDPIDARGETVENWWQRPSDGRIFVYYNVTADVKATCWIPFFGLMIDGGYYRGRLVGGPVVSTKIDMPFVMARYSYPPADPSDNSYQNKTWVYALRKPGAYLEGFFEYDLLSSALMNFGLWGGCTWLRVRGDAEMVYSQTDFAIPFTSANLENQSGAGESTYSRYTLSLGLTGTLNF